MSLKPNLLVAPAPNDYHADHRAVSAGALIAATLQAPVLWVDPMMGNGFLPIYYVGIIPFQDLQEQAILCHNKHGSEYFVEMSQVQGHLRCAQCGQLGGFAEAFCHDPIQSFADIRSLIPLSFSRLLSTPPTNTSSQKPAQAFLQKIIS